MEIVFARDAYVGQSDSGMRPHQAPKLGTVVLYCGRNFMLKRLQSIKEL